MTPEPTSTPVALLSNVVGLAPEQWQFLAVALIVLVFGAGVWISVNV